jgi:hypothetical protein
MTPDPGVSADSVAIQGQPTPIRFAPSKLALFRAELARAQDGSQVLRLESRPVVRWRTALRAFLGGQGQQGGYDEQVGPDYKHRDPADRQSDHTPMAITLIPSRASTRADAGRAPLSRMV